MKRAFWAMVPLAGLVIVGACGSDDDNAAAPAAAATTTTGAGGDGGTPASTTTTSTTTTGVGGFDPVGSGGSGGAACEAPPNQAVDAVLAPEFAQHYTVYDLGPVPGVPDRLGGCVVAYDDPNTLLIAGASETPSGQIYAIGVERGPCGHILGFVGTATPVAAPP